MRFTWMGNDWSMFQNLNIRVVFEMKQILMMQGVVGRWRVEGNCRCY